MSLIDSLPSVRGRRLPRADALVQWLVPLCIILVWQLACVTGFVPVRVLPAPSDVAPRVIKSSISRIRIGFSNDGFTDMLS